MDTPTFDDLAESPPDSAVPWLDRSDVDEATLTPLQREWRTSGCLILPRAIPDALLLDYELWRARRGLPDSLGALPISYGYMFIPEIRRIALHKPVADAMAEVLGEPMALQFDLTQWRSTERAWHQDDYLNAPSINGHYAAAWFAIDDIPEDSGPFEYVPGSHRWPVLRRDRVKAHLSPEQASSERWPSHSERVVTPALEAEMQARAVPTQRFLARRGDVLIWHARLVHRGSRPTNPQQARKALVSHYCGISRVNPDVHEVRHTDEGVPYVHHQYVEFRDWPESTGVRAFAPSA